jgi:hypothetical protein
MAEAVYALCAATSVTCALLLLRGYAAARARLLFWASLCFAGLALNNILLFVDLVLIPKVDLSELRGAVDLAALGVLLFGFIWERQ